MSLPRPLKVSVKSYITPQGPWTHSLQVGQNNGWEFQQELIVTWSWPLWAQRQELLESSPWATAQLVGFGFWNQRCHNATKAGSSGISKLTSSRNWSLSDGKPDLNMLGLMEIHALRSNIFILLVEQLFQLNLPPRSETDLGGQRLRWLSCDPLCHFHCVAVPCIFSHFWMRSISFICSLFYQVWASLQLY